MREHQTRSGDNGVHQSCQHCGFTPWATYEPGYRTMAEHAVVSVLERHARECTTKRLHPDDAWRLREAKCALEYVYIRSHTPDGFAFGVAVEHWITGAKSFSDLLLAHGYVTAGESFVQVRPLFDSDDDYQSEATA